MSSLESLPANTEWASVHSFREVRGIAPGFVLAAPPINPFQPVEYPMPTVPIPDYSKVAPATSRMSDPLPSRATNAAYSQSNGTVHRNQRNRR